MATTKRESTLGKEKRGPSPSNPSITHGQRRSTPPGPNEQQVPNYLKPTISSRSDAIKNAKKAGTQDTSQKPNLLRRRSFDRPPSAARVQKALGSPGRDKPTACKSASLSSKSANAPKATWERAAKKPIAGKPQTTLSSSRSMKKTTSPTPAAKKGSTSSVSKKPLSDHDKNEAQNVETKHGSEETVDHQVEEVVKDDDQGEVDHSEIPRAEESDHHSDVDDTTEVKSVEEGKGTPAEISTVSQEHNVPQTEETEEKFHEEKSDDTQHDVDKENGNKEEANVGDDHQELIPHEEAKTETEDNGEENDATNEVAATEEIGEEKRAESVQENEEGSQQELESSKEEIVEGEVEESKAEAATLVAKSQAQAGHGKKESPTPYNDVIEETASKLLEERKNKVRALVGAFETVIDKETSNAK